MTNDEIKATLREISERLSQIEKRLEIAMPTAIDLNVRVEGAGPPLPITAPLN